MTPTPGSTPLGITGKTIRERLASYLYNHGLFENQAEEVVQRIEANDAHKALNEVLHKDWDDYPREFHAAAILALKAETVKWIDNFFPQHWARAFFDGSV